MRHDQDGQIGRAIIGALMLIIATDSLLRFGASRIDSNKGAAA